MPIHYAPRKINKLMCQFLTGRKVYSTKKNAAKAGVASKGRSYRPSRGGRSGGRSGGARGGRR